MMRSGEGIIKLPNLFIRQPLDFEEIPPTNWLYEIRKNLCALECAEQVERGVKVDLTSL